jgi:hypothetical protein
VATPPRCLAICRRCRNDERRASGAALADELLSLARAGCSARGLDVHARLSQCLHCCDGGHTVRVEHGGNEVSIVGIRTGEELERVLDHFDLLARAEVPERLVSRVWQRWEGGRMVFHRALKGDD